MNTSLDLHLSASPLVATEYGVGFWDGVRRELRMAFGTHVWPPPRERRPVTELEAKLFYSIRHETKRRLCAYYDAPGYKGD